MRGGFSPYKETTNDMHSPAHFHCAHLVHKHCASDTTAARDAFVPRKRTIVGHNYHLYGQTFTFGLPGKRVKIERTRVADKLEGKKKGKYLLRSHAKIQTITGVVHDD